MLGRPDCLAKLPAPLSTLASSTNALHSWDPLNLLFLADYPPNFSEMKVPGSCKALWFCSGLQKYSSKAAFEGGQGQTSLPINTAENFQTLPLHPTTLCCFPSDGDSYCLWHYSGLRSHQLPDLRNKLPFSGELILRKKSDLRTLDILAFSRRLFWPGPEDTLAQQGMSGPGPGCQASDVTLCWLPSWEAPLH